MAKSSVSRRDLMKRAACCWRWGAAGWVCDGGCAGVGGGFGRGADNGGGDSDGAGADAGLAGPSERYSSFQRIVDSGEVAAILFFVRAGFRAVGEVVLWLGDEGRHKAGTYGSV